MNSYRHDHLELCLAQNKWLIRISCRCHETWTEASTAPRKKVSEEYTHHLVTNTHLDSMLETLSESIPLSRLPSALGNGTSGQAPRILPHSVWKAAGGLGSIGPASLSPPVHHRMRSADLPAAVQPHQRLSPQPVVSRATLLSPFRGRCDLRKSSCHYLGHSPP